MDLITAKLDDSHEGEMPKSITIGKEYKVLKYDKKDDLEFVLILNDNGYKFWYTVGEDI